MTDTTPADAKLPSVPFRGIESFRYVDHQIFFARRGETENLLRSSTIYRGVLFYGDSGVGKSSLINAGFLPEALAKGFAPHRLRVHPRRGEEFSVERISESADGNPPYLPSIFFDNDRTTTRAVLSVKEFKRKLTPYRTRELEDRLVIRLKEVGDPLSKYLQKELTEDTRNLISRYDGFSALPEGLRSAMARDLRRLVQEKSLYSEKCFAHVQLGEELRSIAGSNPKGEDLVYLNLSLLEEAYPPHRPVIEGYPLLIFDQFEEFVTLFEIAPPKGELEEALEVQAKILDVLVELLQDDSLSIKLLFSFREDYLAKLTKLFERCPELKEQYVRLTPVQANKLDEIIRGPFKAFPGHFKPEFSTELSDELRDAFARRSEAGIVNLTEVQIASLRLWQSNKPLSVLREGLEPLLAGYLSDALGSFSERMRDPAIALLGRLVTASSVSSPGTRNIVSEEDLLKSVHEREGIPEDLLKETLRKLEEDTKLVRRERRYNVYSYEIVSEFLVPEIVRLREQRNAAAKQRREFEEARRQKLDELEAKNQFPRRTFDERTFIAHLEEAAVEEFAQMLLKPNVQEDTTLRNYFGEARYQRLRSLALSRNARRGAVGTKRGNVVIVHGMMGSHLIDSYANRQASVWPSVPQLINGSFERLRLDENGHGDFSPDSRIRAVGMMKRHYGELLLSLSLRWNVQPFWFDWRKDLGIAADELNYYLQVKFGEGTPVHIVAHSMGGLVARTFIKRYRPRWDEMHKSDPNLRAGGRLVMLGTPNHGSFYVPQMLMGAAATVKNLAALDLRHKLADLLNVFNSFVSVYQMMPSPLVMPEVVKLYDVESYARFGAPVSQRHLDNAAAHHQSLIDVVDPDRMIYVAGFDQPTFDGLKFATGGRYALDDVKGYTVTNDGDGRVPHRLGFLDGAGRQLFPTYFIREDHGNLSSNAVILKALDELLETGETNDLYDNLADAEKAAGGKRGLSSDDLREDFLRQQEEDEARLRRMISRVSDFDVSISPEERKVEETVTRGFLSYRGEDEEAADDYADYDQLIESGGVEIGLVYGGIEAIPYDTIRTAEGQPVDAVAVGHYIGVRPVAAGLALDREISRELRGPGGGVDQGILTEYTERGVIHGKLGQPFFMPDPRGAEGGRARLVVLAGMGEPGRFGAPELTVLVRELCWSLGRMQRRHLATVLIGTGAGNLSMREAVSAWMDGIQRAITGSAFNTGRRLDRVTFVEINPSRYLDLDELILSEKERHACRGFFIEYTPLTERQRKDAQRDERRKAHQMLEYEWRQREKRRESGGEQGRDEWRTPTRVTLELDAARKVYRFGAITDTASVPEREIAVDPAVVMQANDELAGEQSPAMQVERGRLLEALLMPDDLRASLNNNAPLVMLLDSTTARIHWEMVAQPALLASPVAGSSAPSDADPRAFDPMRFLGTARGFTRQLRTTFAPPPEPPPPPRRVLRVLVVADPAEDAHLPGAQEEGAEVADLFESFNAVYKEKLHVTRVEVKRLFGPYEATRTNVLRELMLRRYDVLHFAGHCVYRWDDDPTLSGWIFNVQKREIFTANALTRIDRLPGLVFSNANQFGITPDNSQERSSDLAPSFAEAFFARGVANFVCTAWPVDDAAARVFALTLYSQLLGIKLDRAALSLSGDADPGVAQSEVGKRWEQDARRQMPVPMYEAVRDARARVATLPSGRLTWGAYQHYGNPYFQFFRDPAETPDHATKRAAKAARKKGAPKKSSARLAAKSAAKKAPSKKRGKA